MERKRREKSENPKRVAKFLTRIVYNQRLKSSARPDLNKVNSKVQTCIFASRWCLCGENNLHSPATPDQKRVTTFSLCVSGMAFDARAPEWVCLDACRSGSAGDSQNACSLCDNWNSTPGQASVKMGGACRVYFYSHLSRGTAEHFENYVCNVFLQARKRVIFISVFAVTILLYESPFLQTY